MIARSVSAHRHPNLEGPQSRLGSLSLSYLFALIFRVTGE